LADAFYSPSQNGSLRQGEILSDLRRLIPEPGSVLGDPANLKADVMVHRFAVILSQDCDLAQDYEARSATQQDAKSDNRKLTCVHFCDAIPIDELREQIDNRRVWDFAPKNKNERYQFLRGVQPDEDALGQGIPSGLGLDFKRYFCLTVDDVYAQAKQLKNRRTVLLTPYAEHLSVRFFNYQARIALAKEHHAE